MPSDCREELQYYSRLAASTSGLIFVHSNGCYPPCWCTETSMREALFSVATVSEEKCFNPRHVVTILGACSKNAYTGRVT